MLQTLFDVAVSMGMLLSGLFMLCLSLTRALRRLRGLGPPEAWDAILFYSILGMIVSVSGALGLQCVGREVPLSGVSLVVLAFGIIGNIAMIATEVRRQRHLRTLSED